MAPWPTPGYPELRSGAGILIFPNAASTGLLIGAVFLDTPFPDFLGLLPGNYTGANPSAIPSGLPSTTVSAGAPPFSGTPNVPTFTSSSHYAPLPDPSAYGSTSGHGQVQNTAHMQVPSQGQPHAQVHVRGNSPAHTMHAYHQNFAMNSANVGDFSNQIQTQYYNKSQMDGFPGDAALRAALAAAPFDWSVFEDTDGSGSTSPGSTRTW